MEREEARNTMTNGAGQRSLIVCQGRGKRGDWTAKGEETVQVLGPCAGLKEAT